MKKLVVLLAFFMLTSILFSQQSNSDSEKYLNYEKIRLIPRENNGYLAWVNDDPNIKYWFVEVEEQNFSRVGSF